MTETRNSPPFGSETLLGRTSAQNPMQAIMDIGKHLILPVITLVVVNIAGDSRFVRASMLETLSQDYVRTAKAKGLPERVVTSSTRCATRCCRSSRTSASRSRSCSPAPS